MGCSAHRSTYDQDISMLDKDHNIFQENYLNFYGTGILSKLNCHLLCIQPSALRGRHLNSIAVVHVLSAISRQSNNLVSSIKPKVSQTFTKTAFSTKVSKVTFPSLLHLSVDSW